MSVTQERKKEKEKKKTKGKEEVSYRFEIMLSIVSTLFHIVMVHHGDLQFCIHILNPAKIIMSM